MIFNFYKWFLEQAAKNLTIPPVDKIITGFSWDELNCDPSKQGVALSRILNELFSIIENLLFKYEPGKVNEKMNEFKIMINKFNFNSSVVTKEQMQVGKYVLELFYGEVQNNVFLPKIAFALLEKAKINQEK